MPNVYDELYQKPEYYGSPNSKVLKLLSDIRGGKLLDIGCGQGRYSIPLAELGFDVTAIDTSSAAIEYLKRATHIKNLNIAIQNLDAHHLSEFGKFDLILLSEFFHFNQHEVEKELAFIKKIISGVQKGCRIMFIIHDLDDDKNKLIEATSGSNETSVIHQESTVYKYPDIESNQEAISAYFILYLEKR